MLSAGAVGRNSPVRKLVGTLPTLDPVNKLPVSPGKSSHQTIPIDMIMEEVQDPVNGGEERSSKGTVVEIEHVVANLKDPKKGETRYYLRTMAGVSRLSDPFRRNGGIEADYCLTR
jgi:hypothetical protein